VSGRSYNDPVALNFVRRRDIVQWLTPILRATCVTAIPASSMPKARLRCFNVMLRFFPILEFYSSNNGLLIILQADHIVHVFRLNMDQCCVNLTTLQKPNVTRG